MNTPDFNISIEFNKRIGEDIFDAVVEIAGGGLTMTKTWKHMRSLTISGTTDEYHTCTERADGSWGYGTCNVLRSDSKQEALFRGITRSLPYMMAELAGDVAAYEAIRDSHVVTERNDLFLVDL
jgi:hypothetical protein